MIASFRAEMFVLRRSRTAWVLVAVVPLFLLITTYGFGLMGAVVPGGSSQSIAGLLPGQSVIQATVLFALYGIAPFVVLGALMAGDDWQRGTIATSLLQRPGRLSVFLGQTVAMIAACLTSVLATFAVAMAGSTVVRAVSRQAVAGLPDASFPSLSVIARGIAVALLISVVYGALGILLGILLRSAAAAVSVALAWSMIIEPTIYLLGLFAGGGLLAVSNALPQASAITLNGTFGAVGGGAGTAMYLPLPPVLAAVVLGVYLIAFLAIAYVVLAVRDISPAPAGFSLIRRSVARRAALKAPARRVAPAARGTGVAATCAAELGVFMKWPAAWILTLLPTVTILIGTYLTMSILYTHDGQGVISGPGADTVLAGILPKGFVAVTLSSLGPLTTPNGTVAFFLLGTFIVGRSWSDRTISTSLLQRPGRVATSVGQALAIVVLLGVSVVLAFGAAAMTSSIVAIASGGDPTPPDLGTIGGGLAAAILIALAWGGAGALLGAMFRNALGPATVFLLCSVFLQRSLDQFATTLTGIPRTFYELLPNAATNTLAALFSSPGAALTQFFATTTPENAITILATYLILGFGIPVVLTQRRDIG